MLSDYYILLIVYNLELALYRELYESYFGPGWTQLAIDRALTELAYARVNGVL